MADHAGIPLSGKGGFIVVEDVNAEFFMLDNATYQFESDLVAEEFTLGSGGGWATTLHRGNVVPSVTVTLPEDSPSSIETNALVQNCAYTLWCKRGNESEASREYDKFEGAVFKSVAKDNRSNTGTTRQLVATFVNPNYKSCKPASSDLTDYLISIERIEDEPE